MSELSGFNQDKMVESLLGHARLCERIAGTCPDKETSEKFKMLAQECRTAAAAAKELPTPHRPLERAQDITTS
jgi:hypothetical protein